MSAVITKKPPAGRTRTPRPPKKMMPHEALMTVEQWGALPEIKPPYELIDGQLVQKMVTTNEHDWVVGRIFISCSLWAEESCWRFFSQGVGTRLDGFNGFVPDVMGYPPSVKLDVDATYNAPPFIVFEVLSKGTIKADRETKLHAYERGGVSIYVIVDLKKRIMEVRHVQDEKYGKPIILQSDNVWQPTELPGLKLAIAKMWF